MGLEWIAMRRDEAAARSLVEDDDAFYEQMDDDDNIDYALGQAWHGVHWLLTGSADPTSGPASDAVYADMDREYADELTRLVTAPEVVAVADLLARTSTDDLRARFDPAAMEAAELYPVGLWTEPRIFETFLAPAIDGLRDFYAAAAAAKQAVVQYIY